MSNMKKNDEFLAKIKAAGLEDAFGKMNGIAFETFGCHLEDMIGEGIHATEKPQQELIPVWEVAYQDGWLLKEGKFWILENDNAEAEGRRGWVANHTFLSIESAKAALRKKIRESLKGPRTETMVCGSIGMDFIVDEATAKDEEIVHYKIKRQFKTKWEVVEEK